MAISQQEKILGSFSGVKGETWELEFDTIKIDGVEVSNGALSAATFTGSIGGLPLTTVQTDPVAGVRLRAIVSAATTANAILDPAGKPYLSDVRIQFSDGTVRKPRFYFTILNSPTA